jgi:tetraacyldisaccharide 4'-kinase
MHASDLWHSPAIGPAALRTVLTPLSWLYAAGWQSYLALYRLGIKRPAEPHCPVLCVGNLTVGGTGKSPMALMLYELLSQGGRKVAVSCSGYGSARSEDATLAPEGPLVAAQWGDEAAMFRWFQQEMPLIVGRNRVRAAEIAHAHFPGHVLLLDDGFQHLPLRKHVTILLDDPSPKNRRCLPAGPYREPRGNRKRADLVLPGDFQVDWTLNGPVEPNSREPLPPDRHRIQVLSSIGNPQRLMDVLAGSGYRIEREWRRPDHDPLTQGNLFESVDPSLPLIVTAKDWVKLKDRSDLGALRFGVVWNTPRIEPSDRFRHYLDAALDQVL